MIGDKFGEKGDKFGGSGDKFGEKSDKFGEKVRCIFPLSECTFCG